MSVFMFATGIENSYPTIAMPNGSRRRVDEMERCGHYDRWNEDFECAKALGVEHLRYGPAYYKTHQGPGRYDWAFPDEAFRSLQIMGLHPIADLCHFGVPDWLENFQNPDFPRYFAEYARAFALRYPWINLYTPVNEIYIAATFSAQYGWWNEGLSSDRAFVTALKHLCQANLLAMNAILEVQPNATFIQSESTEYYHPEGPECLAAAQTLNQKRFLPLDLTYAQPVNVVMYEYLLDNGMTREEYHWFGNNNVKAHCVMGNDYYVTNEHLVRTDGSITASGEIFGYYVITRQYFERYRLPVMHTETNIHEPDAVRWLWKEWANVYRLRLDGVPLVGFTWFSLTDQIDWDTALREDAGRINPLGLYDLDRKLRPVGRAYRKLISQWKDILPVGSYSLLPSY